MSRLLRSALNQGARRKVVIIQGNPDKMVGKEDLAQDYYRDITEYVEQLGFAVEIDAGEPRTCPSLDAVFWIAHSRGVDREMCIPEDDRWRFLKFGSLDGVIHPKDASWQKTIRNHITTQEMPPPEHFEFTREQQRAIDALVRQV